MIINPYVFASGPAPFGGAVSTANLVEWWPLSEASGTRAGVHAGLDMTDTNTVTGVSGGGPDGSDVSQFTAANSEWLERNSEAALQTGDISHTWVAWFRVTNLSTLRTIFGKDSSTAGQREYYMGVVSDGRIFFNVFRATDAAVQPILPVGTIVINTWYFVAGWHDASADTASIEINANGTINTVATGGALQAASSAKFEIGARQYPSNTFPFDGQIQRVGFWKRVLTSGERTALYNSGNGLDY